MAPSTQAKESEMTRKDLVSAAEDLNKTLRLYPPIGLPAGTEVVDIGNLRANDLAVEVDRLLKLAVPRKMGVEELKAALQAEMKEIKPKDPIKKETRELLKEIENGSTGGAAAAPAADAGVEEKPQGKKAPPKTPPPKAAQKAPPKATQKVSKEISKRPPISREKSVIDAINRTWQTIEELGTSASAIYTKAGGTDNLRQSIHIAHNVAKVVVLVGFAEADDKGRLRKSTSK